MRAIFILLIMFVMIGCQKESKTDLTLNEGISITDTWIRPGVKDRNTAAFMKIANNTPNEDTLFSADSDLAKVVEIHETFTRENDMKGMRQIDYILLPPNSIIELKPMGLHVMLIGLMNDLRSGDEGVITLRFKTSGDKTISASVK